METAVLKFFMFVLNSVLTVPMRNGNMAKYGIPKSHVLRVLTVPMRNGNYYLFPFLSILFVKVLTVPMRNGNPKLYRILVQRCYSFLPYL